MTIGETLKSAERTLKEAQQLMGKIQKQNETWPGVGALEKDIATAIALLHEMEQILSDIFVKFSLDLDTHPDSDLEIEVSQAFNETYSLMSQLWDAVNQVHVCWQKRSSQSDAITKVEKHLKQLTNHCIVMRDHFIEITQLANHQSQKR